MSVSYFDFVDNASVRIADHFPVAGVTSSSFQISAAGVTDKVNAPGDFGIKTLAPAATTITAIATSSGAVGFARLDTNTSQVDARIRWNVLGAAGDSVSIGFSSNSAAVPSNGIYVSVSNAGVLSFVSRKASVTTTATPSVPALVTGQWYQFLVLVADKAAGLVSIVSTSATPGAVSATINQNGAYAFYRVDTTYNPSAPWIQLGRFDMSLVPTGAGQEVNSGLWVVGSAAPTVSVDADLLTYAQAGS
jgi:hypothetical protein